MAEGGIQNLTMKNIARALNISEPAIYRHFQVKWIFCFRCSQFKQHSGDHLRSARAERARDWRSLKRSFSNMSERFANHPHMTAVVFSEEAFQDDTRLAEQVFSIMTTADETIAEVIAEAQHSSEIRADLPKEHT